MQLHWGRDFIQQLLPINLLHRLKEAETDPWFQLTPHLQNNVPVYNGQTGEVLVELTRPLVCRYSRARMIKLLGEGVDVQHDRKLVDIDVHPGGSVTARFADGSTVTGDLLIGADSASSAVRTWLVGKEAAACSEPPIIAYNFCARYPAEQAKLLREHPHPLMKCAIHPEQKTWYMIVPLEVHDPQRPEEWVFQHFMNLWSDAMPSEDPKQRWRHFQELGAAHAEPFRSAALEVDEGTFIPYDRLKYWAKPVAWEGRGGGRVTIAGDAAHPMTPRRQHFRPVELESGC